MSNSNNSTEAGFSCAQRENKDGGAPLTAPAPLTDELKRERDSFERMFLAACADLGLVNEALGLDPDDGGADPILEAIEELKTKAAAVQFDADELRKLILNVSNTSHWCGAIGGDADDYAVALAKANAADEALFSYVKNLAAPAPQQSEPIATEAQISAAGSALADRSADSCGVNREDNWMIYGSEFIEDARVAFAAAAKAAPAAPVQTEVPGELTDDAIDDVWNAMPGGVDGWLKQFGYRQFARVIARHVLVRVAASMAGTIRPTDDELWEQTIGERDLYHEWADKLANAIATHFGAEIGEHSNMNCPWAEALDVIQAAPAAPEKVQASIDTPEFRTLLDTYSLRFPSARAIEALVEHIDARLAAPSAAAPAAPEQDEVLFDLRDAILDALSRKAAPHAWESLVSETAYRFITERCSMKTATNEGSRDE